MINESKKSNHSIDELIKTKSKKYFWKNYENKYFEKIRKFTNTNTRKNGKKKGRKIIEIRKWW